jgi:hypothetical protein
MNEPNEQQSEQITSGAPSAGADEGDRPLGVEDIPGAVPVASEQPAESDSSDLRARLAAFRARRGEGGQGRPGGGGGGGGRAGGGRRGGGQGEGRGRLMARPEAGAAGGTDPITAGRKILDRLSQRFADDTSNERQWMRSAVLGLKGGYDALEQEVARLRAELNAAHEAVRAVQRESD